MKEAQILKNYLKEFLFQNVAVRKTVYSGEVSIISIDHGDRIQELFSGASESLVKAFHGQ